MNDNTIEHNIPRPSGPKRRPSLSRMNDITNGTMGKNKGKKTNTPPKKDQNSLKLDEKFKRNGGSPASSGLYPDLSKEIISIVDGSFTSTIDTSNDQSSNESRTNNSSIYNNSSEIDRSTEFSEAEFEQQPFNQSHDNILVEKDLGNSKNLEKSLDNSKILEKYPDNRKSLEKYLENIKSLKKYPGKSKSQEKSTSSSFSCRYIIFPLIFVGFASVIKIAPSYLWSESNENLELKQRITDLRGLFPTQNKTTWSEIGTGIHDVLTKEHTPAIFLLLASDNETNNCLAKKVGELARSILGGTGDVILTPDKLENNISKVLDLTENRVKQTKAVVVLDLLSVQPQAIKAFHDICDEYNPLVAEAVYLFTMRSGKHKDSRNLKDVAEKQLTEKFSADIKENTLKALIVRFTSGAVLAINEEKSIPC